VRFFQSLRALATADLYGLAADRNGDSIAIQFAVAGCTSFLGHFVSFQHPKSGYHQ
jgi:hypothetical protein